MVAEGGTEDEKGKSRRIVGGGIERRKRGSA